MKIARFPLMLLFCVVSSVWAEESKPSVDELLRQLEAAVREEAKKTAVANDPRTAEASHYLSQGIVNVRRSLAADGSGGNLQDVLAQIQTVAASEEVRHLSEALAARAEEEAKVRDRAFIDATDAMVGKAVEVALAAKDPKELDAWIVELSNLKGSRSYNSSEAVNRSVENARGAVTFLCRWQDFLMQGKSGNERAAQEVLKNLAQNTSSYPFVPRSAVLERMGTSGTEKGETEESPPDLKGKKLADLPTLVRETAELRRLYPGSTPIMQRLQSLQELSDAAAQARSGIYGRAFGVGTNQFSGNRDEDLIPLQQELLLQILPDYMEIDQGYAVKPEESPVNYLQRVIAEAKSKADWKTAWKALECYQSVAFGNGNRPNWINGDIQGISQFIIGQNCEAAGLYPDAVRAYKRVVSQTGDKLPIEQAKQRLEAIQKEHPADYEAANKQTETVRPYPVSVPYPR